MPRTDTSLNPLPRLDDQPTFTEGWQAQVLAIAQNLVDEGTITANDWSNALGAALRKTQTNEQTDTAENYYQAALDALEAILQMNCGISDAALKQRKSDWIRAYEDTPHGAPVEL